MFPTIQLSLIEIAIERKLCQNPFMYIQVVNAKHLFELSDMWFSIRFGSFPIQIAPAIIISQHRRYWACWNNGIASSSSWFIFPFRITEIRFIGTGLIGRKWVPFLIHPSYINEPLFHFNSPEISCSITWIKHNKTSLTVLTEKTASYLQSSRTSFSQQMKVGETIQQVVAGRNTSLSQDLWRIEQ